MSKVDKEELQLRAIDADLLSDVSPLKKVIDMHIEKHKMYISKILRNKILDTIEVAQRTWPSDETLCSGETKDLCDLLSKKTTEVINIPIKDKKKASDVLGHIEKKLKDKREQELLAKLLVIGVMVYKVWKENEKKPEQTCADILHLLFENAKGEDDITAREDRTKLGKAGLVGYSHAYNDDGGRNIELSVKEGSEAKLRAELCNVLKVKSIDNTVSFRNVDADAVTCQDFVRGEGYRGGSVACVIHQGSRNFVLTAAHVVDDTLQNAIDNATLFATHPHVDGYYLLYNRQFDVAFVPVSMAINHNSLIYPGTIPRHAPPFWDLVATHTECVAEAERLKQRWLIVAKLGKTTGGTVGKLRVAKGSKLRDGSADVEWIDCAVVDEYEVVNGVNVPFTQPGDSGALYMVLIAGQLKPVAIHRGHLGNISYGTWLEDVLTRVDGELGGIGTLDDATVVNGT